MIAAFPYLRQAVVGSRLRRNISYTLGRQVLAAAAQLLLVVVIARTLGPEGNGQYAMAILLPSMLVTCLNLGVGPATVYYLGRKEVTPSQAARENALMACVIAAIGTMITLIAVNLWGEKLFPGIPLALVVLGIVAFPISLLLSYLNTILQGLEDFRAFNWTVLLPPYATLTGAVLALYVLDLGATAAVGSYIIGQITGLVLVLYFLCRRCRKEGFTTRGVAFKHYKRQVLSYGYRAHLANVLSFVNYRADIFLVNFLLTPAATGLYVIAVQFSERLWMLSQAASTVLLPRLSAMHVNPQERFALTQKVFVVVAALTSVGTLIVVLALYWLLEPVFGPDYKDVFAPFLWLIPGVVAGSGARVQSNCIAAAGKPEWNMYVALFVVFLNITGSVLLIPLYGIIGAAMATSAAYIANAIVKSILIRKV